MDTVLKKYTKSVKSYMVVFGVLCHWDGRYRFCYFRLWIHDPNVIVALIIATIKASCVALIFMHLNAEKKTIYMTLAFTWFFFMGLMGLDHLGFGGQTQFYRGSQ